MSTRYEQLGKAAKFAMKYADKVSPGTFRADAPVQRFVGSATFSPKGVGAYKSKPIPGKPGGTVFTTKLPTGTSKETIFSTALADSTMTYGSVYKANILRGTKIGADPKAAHEYADVRAKIAGHGAATTTRGASNYSIGYKGHPAKGIKAGILAGGYGTNLNEVIGGKGGSREATKIKIGGLHKLSELGGKLWRKFFSRQ